MAACFFAGCGDEGGAGRGGAAVASRQSDESRSTDLAAGGAGRAGAHPEVSPDPSQTRDGGVAHASGGQRDHQDGTHDPLASMHPDHHEPVAPHAHHAAIGRAHEGAPADDRRAPGHAAPSGSGAVRLLRTPGGGVQPQAAVDGQGAGHLVYLVGEPGSSNVEYVRRAPGEDEFSEPIRVNSEPGSAVAIGTIRGAQVAVGRNDRVHVAWNGSGGEMWYARMNDEGTAFEPQRNLMQRTYALDGGGSVAADGEGNVYVVWHAAEEGGPPGEEGRRVYVARSEDDGGTFAPEVAVFGEDAGACGCCGLRALADAAGDLYVLYRSGWDRVHRDTYLLACGDGSLGRCAGEVLDPWLTEQ